MEASIISRDGLGELMAGLRRDGYTLIGPRVRDGAIVEEEIDGIDDLPAGWTDHQEAGSYRLERCGGERLFGFSHGPDSHRRLFFPPRTELVRIRRQGGSFVAEAPPSPARKLALVGTRSCDLHAVAIQDRVFLGGATVDADYAARRADVFVMAVHCGQAGGTCFCASMGTGPRAMQGFDLAMTELLDPHRFVVEAATEAGRQRLAAVQTSGATGEDRRAAEDACARAEASMGRRMDTGGIKELLYLNQEHPRWDDVAARCLSCTNCTLVCPTCFCSSVEDGSDLGGETAVRTRRWDSCFSLDHSYLHGGSVRASVRARYRQWLTHKLASWIDQFGTSGCVGCGRCITWCPPGIDITEEVAALRAGS